MPKISNMPFPCPPLPGTPNRPQAVLNRGMYKLASPIPLPQSESVKLPVDQRAIAILERSECFVRRDSRTQFVIVAGIFRFFGLLHLEQIRVVQLAAVGAYRALPEQRG